MTSRSPTLVVATEQEAENAGFRPRSFRAAERDPAETAGVVRHAGSSELKSPMTALLMAQAFDSLRPHGRNRYCRADRSRPVPRSASILSLIFRGTPSGTAGNGSCAPVPINSAARKLPHRMDHPALRVVEPFADEIADQRLAEFGRQLLQPALADPRRTDHRQVIAIPLVGHSDPPPAHPDDVVDVLVVALYSARTENSARLPHRRRAQTAHRSSAGCCRSRPDELWRSGEQMLAVDEDRHQNGMVGAVRVAEYTSLCKNASPSARSACRSHIASVRKCEPKTWTGRPFGGSQQLVVAGDQ